MPKSLDMQCSLKSLLEPQRAANCARVSMCVLVLCASWLTLLVSEHAHAAAGALDLLDPTPREVVVLFEVSPQDAPAQMNVRFSPEFKASFEPGARPSEARVVIPAQTVEQYLVGDQNPIADSFSDFVWTFDVETGHVISAQLHGRVMPELDWGFTTTQTEAQIHVEMGTARLGGFKRPRRVLGQLVFTYCSKVEEPDCQLVETAPLDRATGYVNAIGQVWVHSTIVDLWNFSPMGEAIFREAERPLHGFAAGEVGVGSSQVSEVWSAPGGATAAAHEPEHLQ